MSRIWRLNINLDAFNSMAASFYSDEQRALAFQGFLLGMNGGSCPESAPAPFASAFEIGASSRAEAEEHQASSARGGMKSAEARKAKFGTAQPSSLEAEHFEGGFEGGLEVYAEGGVEPNLKPQASSLLTSNLKPQAQNTTTRRSRAEFDHGMFDHMIPTEFALSGKFVEAWHSWVSDRKARRKPITEAGAKTQLAKLEREAVTPEAARTWIEHSLASGYQGIYAPSAQQRPRTAPAPQFNGFSQTNYTKGTTDADLQF